MDIFNKLTIQDNDLKCYNFKPFYKNTLTELDKIEGKPITANMRNLANIRFNNMTNLIDSVSTKCCDPKNPVSNPTEHKIYNDFVIQYPKCRLIKNSSNEITKIQLSTSNEITGTGWTAMSPYVYCKVSKAGLNNSIIKPSVDGPNVYDVEDLLNDCATEKCGSSSKSLKNLFNDTVNNTGLDTEDIHFDNYVETLFESGNDKALVDALIKLDNPNHRLSSNSLNNRLIHMAAIHNNKRILDIILTLKPNLDVKNKDGDTALHLAVKNNNILAIIKLIDAGASKNITNKKGMTPIMTAVLNDSDDKLHNNFYLMKLMHNNGGDIFTVDKEGNTLVHLAIIHKVKNIINIINYLISNGIELNIKNKDGKTPLMLLEDIIENDLVLTEQKTALLSIQNTIFYSIIKQNPEKYGEYIPLSELPEGGKTLFDYQEYRCFNPDKVDGIVGNEGKKDCVKKGGLYKKVHTSTKVKLSFPEENEIKDSELYKPRMENRLQPERPVHPLIAAINADAKSANEMIKTTTENDFAGEYMSRDKIVLSPDYEDDEEIDNLVSAFEEEDNNETIVEKFTVNDNEIIEGFNNSADFLKIENIKKYGLFALFSVIIVLFLYFSYKLF